MEKISHAAIIAQNGKVFKGKSHADCFAKMLKSGNKYRKGSPNNQGFLTNTGMYVTRKEAAEIAFKAKQIDKEVDYLLSEALWSPMYNGKHIYKSREGYVSQWQEIIRTFLGDRVFKKFCHNYYKLNQNPIPIRQFLDRNKLYSIPLAFRWKETKEGKNFWLDKVFKLIRYRDEIYLDKPDFSVVYDWKHNRILTVPVIDSSFDETSRTTILCIGKDGLFYRVPKKYLINL